MTQSPIDFCSLATYLDTCHIDLMLDWVFLVLSSLFSRKCHKIHDDRAQTSWFGESPGDVTSFQMIVNVVWGSWDAQGFD